jgi:hypothetical protein
MATLEERVAFLEGRVVEQARASDGIRDAISSLERRIDARFGSMEQRVADVEGSVRHLSQRLDQRCDAMDTRFIWLVGIQVTTLAAVIGALVTR